MLLSHLRNKYITYANKADADFVFRSSLDKNWRSGHTMLAKLEDTQLRIAMSATSFSERDATNLSNPDTNLSVIAREISGHVRPLDLPYVLITRAEIDNDQNLLKLFAQDVSYEYELKHYTKGSTAEGIQLLKQTLIDKNVPVAETHFGVTKRYNKLVIGLVCATILASVAALFFAEEIRDLIR